MDTYVAMVSFSSHIADRLSSPSGGCCRDLADTTWRDAPTILILRTSWLKLLESMTAKDASSMVSLVSSLITSFFHRDKKKRNW